MACVPKHKIINYSNTTGSIRCFFLALIEMNERTNDELPPPIWFIAIPCRETPRIHTPARAHKPVVKGMDVPASQRSPSMKLPTVKALASAALVMTRYPFHLTRPDVPAPGPVFMYSP